MDSEFVPLAKRADVGCVTLIGVAGCGKTTVGSILAQNIDFAHLDTDLLIEAYYGTSLKDLLKAYGPGGFLHLEEEVILEIGVRRSIISTGGSVIYGRRGMKMLKTLGPVVYLEISRATFLERVKDPQNRALVALDGKTQEEVFAERLPLYQTAADFVLPLEDLDPEQAAGKIAEYLDKIHFLPVEIY